MMKILYRPGKEDLRHALRRPSADNSDIDSTVREIIAGVRAHGDSALRQYSRRYDGYAPLSLRVDDDVIADSVNRISDELRESLQTALMNIRSFHPARVKEKEVVRPAAGVTCWSRELAIERVGLYIPGGTAPLFSTVLMLAVPARQAGCREIIMCTPPQRDGTISPLILYAASLAGVTSIYMAGGAQAIAAMAYGTESVPQVYKIFGPGNSYVTRAKELVQLDGTAIDMPAGPSEVMVIADKSANPSFIAADMLSQAEHGPDSQAVMLTDDRPMIDLVKKELEKQMSGMERKTIAAMSIANSSLILLDTIDECMAVSNSYAPEHLIIATDKPYRHASGVINAGSVFIGNYSCESTGDYITGPNHTLPTGGYARSHSGITTGSFMKKIFFQEVTQQGIMNIGPATEIMASAEMLYGHRNAVSVRLKYINDEKNRRPGKA